jgi:hypothetical protein
MTFALHTSAFDPKRTISRPKLIAPPQFAPVCVEREILKQK